MNIIKLIVGTNFNITKLIIEHYKTHNKKKKNRVKTLFINVMCTLLEKAVSI